jgi:hypothetical protein
MKVYFINNVPHMETENGFRPIDYHTFQMMIELDEIKESEEHYEYD